MKWSARQYTTFEAERTRPIRDLLSAIPPPHLDSDIQRFGEGVHTIIQTHGHEPHHERMVAIDLGCGPGNSTQVLASKYPHAHVIGMDSSVDMIHAAQTRMPHIQFELADIQTWHETQKYDVILANASLQWLPDHDRLFPRLVHQLKSGGTLAVQMPDNLNEPAHLLMQQVAQDANWAGKLSGCARLTLHNATWYYQLLQPFCTHVDIWRTTYTHVLHGSVVAIVEWFKGTSLRPYLERLTLDEQTEFLSRYEQLLSHAYPELDHGVVLLPFPRLFIVATR